MRMVKWVVIALGVLIVALTVVGFLLPSHVEVSRSTVIQAPPSAIYPLIADFKSGWSQWNAFDKEDPGIAYSFSGPASGPGAVQSWTSRKMGDGKMTVTKGDTLNGITFDLLIGPKPFRIEGTLRTEKQDGSTRRTWTDIFDLGINPFQRWMGQLISKMIGTSFEKSLANIKRIAESQAPAKAAP